MGYFDNQIITSAGEQLLAATELGEKLTFVSIRVGDGEYSIPEISTLKERTALKNQRQEFPITNVSVEKNTIRIKSVISNDKLTNGYYIREIGVVVKDTKGAESMLAISICSGNNATFLPGFQSMPIEIPFSNNIGFSGSGKNIEIQYSSDVYARLEDVAQLQEQVNQALELAGTASSIITSQINPKLGMLEGKLQDNFESGTWKPSLVSYSIDQIVGYYKKIGDICFIQCGFKLGTKATSGTFALQSLPFPVAYYKNGEGFQGSGLYRLNGFARTSKPVRIKETDQNGVQFLIPVASSSAELNAYTIEFINPLENNDYGGAKIGSVPANTYVEMVASYRIR